VGRSGPAGRALLATGTLLFLFGAIGVVYHVLIYPSMVPHYGGGEQLCLSGGSVSLLVESEGGLVIWLESDSRVVALVDGQVAGEGERLTLEIPPGAHDLTIEGREGAEVSLRLRQAPSVRKILAYATLSALGLTVAWASLFGRWASKGAG